MEEVGSWSIWDSILASLASSPGPSSFSVCNIEKLGGPGDEANLATRLEIHNKSIS